MCLHKHEASFKAKYSVDASIVDTIWTVVDHRCYSCWHWIVNHHRCYPCWQLRWMLNTSTSSVMSVFWLLLLRRHCCGCAWCAWLILLVVLTPHNRILVESHTRYDDEDGDDDDIMVSTAAKSWVSTTANERYETITLRSRCDQDDVRMSTTAYIWMSTTVKWRMWWCWCHEFITRSSFYVIILRDRDPWSFPCGGSGGPVEEDPEPEPSQNAQCTLHTAHCTAATSYIWWNNLDCHFSQKNCTYCTTSVLH